VRDREFHRSLLGCLIARTQPALGTHDLAATRVSSDLMLWISTGVWSGMVCPERLGRRPALIPASLYAPLIHVRTDSDDLAVLNRERLRDTIGRAIVSLFQLTMMRLDLPAGASSIVELCTGVERAPFRDCNSSAAAD
jgi:hypothetical protein